MVGMGTVQFPLVHEATKNAVLAAIEVGFRHFDTAFMYGTEKPLGEAVAEALRRGLLQSREELFVTSKLWCSQNHPASCCRPSGKLSSKQSPLASPLGSNI